MKGRVQIYKCGSMGRHKVSAKICTRCLISLQFAFRVSDQDRLRLKFPLLNKSLSHQTGSLVWIITLLYSTVIWKCGCLIVHSLIKVLTLSLEKIDDSWRVCNRVPFSWARLTGAHKHFLSPTESHLHIHQEYSFYHKSVFIMFFFSQMNVFRTCPEN